MEARDQSARSTGTRDANAHGMVMALAVYGVPESVEGFCKSIPGMVAELTGRTAERCGTRVVRSNPIVKSADAKVGQGIAFFIGGVQGSVSTNNFGEAFFKQAERYGVADQKRNYWFRDCESPSIKRLQSLAEQVLGENQTGGTRE